MEQLTGSKLGKEYDTGTELADLDVEFRPIMVVKHLSHSGGDIQQFIKWVLRS